MNWNEFAKEVHQMAVEHGWREKRPSFADMVVMFHSELSEAVEEYRKGRPNLYHECMCKKSGSPCVLDLGGDLCGEADADPCSMAVEKPQGVAVELADCILRILDTLAEAGVDIDSEIGYCPAYGDVIQTIARCHHHISEAYIQTTKMLGSMTTAYARLLMCIGTILDWAERNGLDMEAILRAKHEYNKTRPYRHGGKVL